MISARQRIRRGLFSRRRNRRIRSRSGIWRGGQGGGLSTIPISPMPTQAVPQAVDVEATVPMSSPPPADEGHHERAKPSLRLLIGETARRAWLLVPALRRTVPLFLLLVSGIAVGSGSWAVFRTVVTSPHFAVREVITPSLIRVTREEILDVAAVEPGINIFRVNIRGMLRNLAAHPWLTDVKVRRELPSRIVIEAREREPAMLVELGGLYLADKEGSVFKRAEPEETANLVVVTGIRREEYIKNPVHAQARLKAAIGILEVYRIRPGRPTIGEIHLEEDGGTVLYTAESAIAIRLGEGDLQAKLERFDTVWQLLGPRKWLARAMFLDNRARPDRVTVRFHVDPDEPDASRRVKKER